MGTKLRFSGERSTRALTTEPSLPPTFTSCWQMCPSWGCLYHHPFLPSELSVCGFPMWMEDLRLSKHPRGLQQQIGPARACSCRALCSFSMQARGAELLSPIVKACLINPCSHICSLSSSPPGTGQRPKESSALHLHSSLGDSFTSSVHIHLPLKLQTLSLKSPY